MEALVPANDNVPNRAAYRTSFTGNNEWYTPSRFVELARQVLGAIDIDPASNAIAQETVKAATYYTQETNGLDKPWNGKVWMNPPYSRNLIGRFIDKMVEEYRTGRCTEAIVLTHNSSDTRWAAALFGGASALCFTRGRVKFVSPKGKFAAPAMGQLFSYFGRRPDRFASVFREVGHIVTPSNDNSRGQAAA